MASDTATASPEPANLLSRRERAEARAQGGAPGPRIRGGWPLGSRLGRLIIVLNLLGLAILVGGALVLNELRQGLVNARLEGLLLEAKVIVNVIDPNRVVGQPYYIRTVELKNGRIESGLLHAEDDQSITLKVENDVLKVIQKKDIEGKVLDRVKAAS